MVEESKSNVVELDLKNLTARKGLDFDEFSFMDSKIELIETREFPDKKTGEKRLALLIKSAIVKEGTQLRATEFINIWIDEKSKEICYSDNAGSNAKKMLSFFKVNSFDELIGKDCKIVVRVKDNGSKDLGLYFG